MTTYTIFLLLYLIPLTLDVIFFAIFKKSIEKELDATVIHYMKIIYFIPVLNILQTISFLAYIVILIRYAILFYCVKIKFALINYKQERMMKRAAKQIIKKIVKAGLVKKSDCSFTIERHHEES